MVCHMKTTLNIDDTVMAKLKRESARQGRTMSELVETALRRFFPRSGTTLRNCHRFPYFAASFWSMFPTGTRCIAAMEED